MRALWNSSITMIRLQLRAPLCITKGRLHTFIKLGLEHKQLASLGCSASFHSFGFDISQARNITVTGKLILEFRRFSDYVSQPRVQQTSKSKNKYLLPPPPIQTGPSVTVYKLSSNVINEPLSNLTWRHCLTSQQCLMIQSVVRIMWTAA